MSDQPELEGTYIRFVPGRLKTKVWFVYAKRKGECLGTIEWFDRWRKYSFFPTAASVFEEVCMREISDFIVARTREDRKER